MRRAEIAGITEFGVGQTIRHIGVADGAFGLRRGRHRPGALMFGVAIDAAAFGFSEVDSDAVERALEPARIATRHHLTRQRRMFMRFFMAGRAGGVGHRDKGIDMAGLAIVP